MLPQWDRWLWSHTGLLDMLAGVDTRVWSEAASPEDASTRRIVVGFDDSQSSEAVLSWAAREAVARGCVVRVVACLPMPGTLEHGGRPRERLHAAVDQVRRRHHGLRVEATDARVDPQHALLGEAVGAELMVVGASTSSAARRWIFGSVPSTVARRSSCPVVVVHGGGGEDLRRIAVGLDGTNAAAAALDWAVDEANLHAAAIMLVHTWEPPGNDRSLRSLDLRGVAAECALDLAVRSCRQRTSQSVRGTLCQGDAASALVAATSDADLIVVGSRGRSGFRTMLFGSVASSVMNGSECPVVVVHPRLRT